MGKKNKKSSKFPRPTDSISPKDFISLEDEIIQHLQLLKEVGGLVIGLNAVLRGLKKKSFCVIILISRKATSAMYHALNMLCKNTDVIFLQLQDISCITSYSKIPSSTAYGIKTSILTEQQKFEKLIDKINRTRNSPKFKKQRHLEKLSPANDDDIISNENVSCQEDNEYYKNENDGSAVDIISLSDENQYNRTNLNSFIHTSHVQSTRSFSGSEYGFLRIKEIEFPDYSFRSDEVSFCIK